MKKFTLALLLLCSFAFSARADSRPIRICGQVVEIVDGDTFILKIRDTRIVATLQHIDSPEDGQPYSEIAKKHLADLVLGKEICLDLNQIDEDENIWIGDAYIGRMNVGMQMARDGVAWYNNSDDSLLDELDLRLFSESEQAARNERRGIWRDSAPVAPWDYRRLYAAKYGLDPSVVNRNVVGYGGQGNDSSVWKTVHVRAYYRSNGTHVNSYWRSAPGTKSGGRTTSGRARSSGGGRSSGRGGRH